jgi:hypothetical protein
MKGWIIKILSQLILFLAKDDKRFRVYNGEVEDRSWIEIVRLK